MGEKKRVYEINAEVEKTLKLITEFSNKYSKYLEKD